ncbi:NADPH2:quinone reductase [Fictibacillus enclensis]|uniref:Alcohol dehydrogenase n=1 Tax=Fictibacillus enclensis TaxID=1017270 RepID=A0A0V8J933_9BACL|nr:quinone oxidoreductase [Fictibacillus enclensis]KSU83477.1 alcohol dehydrogenase [Fictibacillus enclensis]SCC16117.1 NADPH2:quinone reductase [Fictibacillus enclensis]
MKALTFHTFGGPEVLQYQDVPTPELNANEILVEMKAIGLNFADIYRRKGNYHLLGNPPYIAGYEGAGVVKSVGSSVQNVKEGDRVAFADVPYANAEYVAVPEDHLIPLPEKISFETAASILLQGLTAQFLTRDSYAVGQGTLLALHAAAGGVGQLLIQISKALGAEVIGLASSESKKEAALAAGADHVFLYNEDWVNKVKQASSGLQGVDVIYDSVGSTLMDSFEAVRTGGTVVFYGMAGGDPSPVDPRMLMDTSKTLTGGDLWNVITSHWERVSRSQELFDLILSGAVKVPEMTYYPLEQGAEAHRFLESRKSTGKILLIP